MELEFGLRPGPTSTNQSAALVLHDLKVKCRGKSLGGLFARPAHGRALDGGAWLAAGGGPGFGARKKEALDLKRTFFFFSVAGEGKKQRDDGGLAVARRGSATHMRRGCGDSDMRALQRRVDGRGTTRLNAHGRWPVSDRRYLQLATVTVTVSRSKSSDSTGLAPLTNAHLLDTGSRSRQGMAESSRIEERARTRPFFSLLSSHLHSLSHLYNFSSCLRTSPPTPDPTASSTSPACIVGSLSSRCSAIDRLSRTQGGDPRLRLAAHEKIRGRAQRPLFILSLHPCLAFTKQVQVSGDRNVGWPAHAVKRRSARRHCIVVAQRLSPGCCLSSRPFAIARSTSLGRLSAVRCFNFWMQYPPT
ncbi:hypothetical protein M440DRAFT_1012908 [Trichoderma longibrachiatum ATCC 18648]|uniref:Uncharacterized protein n=1 Tax=Trichoderma longibrachiatum ATCC 18648 TaxID=983965 RepID=A0A2T4CIC4_TRILO|nr:hypothetical protein M440DRAFT_1012908 [Trichoderma longibrachiatum ATCC 18648]